MIKFFRKIRQRLLTENKFSKYLLYAIGEIALVMIGILLALQVSNWNQKRIESIRLDQYITSMLNDLDLDKERLQECLKLDSSKVILIDNASDPLPNLLIGQKDPDNVNELLGTNSLIIHDATFSSMSSSNAMELFKNIETQKAISDYYSRMRYVKRFEDLYINSILPDFIDYINQNQNPKLKEIQGYLRTSRSVSISEVNRYKDLISRLDTLKINLKRELNKK